MVGIQLHQTAQRCRIAYSTEYIFTIEHLAIRLDAAAIGAQGVQIVQTFKDVCQMPQCVFCRLRGGVRRPGKGPEGCHIGKIAAVMLPQILLPWLRAGRNGISCRHGL